MTDTLNAPPIHDPLQSQQAPQNAQEKAKERRAGAFWWWGAGLLLLIAAILAGLYYGGYLGKGRASKQKVDNAFVFRIDGKDQQGRKAAFDFIVLGDEYTWVKSSTAELVSKDEKVVPDAEVASRVFAPRIRESLSRTTDLIAVGLASQEGERAQEEERAKARSETVAGWMQALNNPGIPLWVLTLGQYNRACKSQEDADTSFERPLILVGVRSKDNGTNLQEALADAISGHDNLPSRECYSRFDMTKVR
jgi:hypothetical protein